jgi:hypothetical protein
MFKIDIDAIRQAATNDRLVAKAASLANFQTDSKNSGQSISHYGESPQAPSFANADTDSVVSLNQLIEIGMQICSHFDDSIKAREAMRTEIIETPATLRADLLEHFMQTYGHLVAERASMHNIGRY